MALSLTCKRCHEVVTGADEDELVALVQAHVRGHNNPGDRDHNVSREHILTRLRRQDRTEDGHDEDRVADGSTGARDRAPARPRRLDPSPAADPKRVRRGRRYGSLRAPPSHRKGG